jgi:hypothetical protein
MTSAVQRRILTSWLFTSVQKLLRIDIFSLTGYRKCLLLFAWVGLLLSSDGKGEISRTTGDLLFDTVYGWVS